MNLTTLTMAELVSLLSEINAELWGEINAELRRRLVALEAEIATECELERARR
jgi:hypothetical protein